jgi:hypothetical protein
VERREIDRGDDGVRLRGVARPHAALEDVHFLRSRGQELLPRLVVQRPPAAGPGARQRRFQRVVPSGVALEARDRENIVAQ